MGVADAQNVGLQSAAGAARHLLRTLFLGQPLQRNGVRVHAGCAPLATMPLAPGLAALSPRLQALDGPLCLGVLTSKVNWLYLE